MSISQRIRKNSSKKLDELQAKIVLLKKKKYSITELLDKVISFSFQHENEFIDYLLNEKQKPEVILHNEAFFTFLHSPAEGAGPEDYEEYDYNDLD